MPYRTPFILPPLPLAGSGDPGFVFSSPLVEGKRRTSQCLTEPPSSSSSSSFFSYSTRAERKRNRTGSDFLFAGNLFCGAEGDSARGRRYSRPPVR